MQIQRLRNLTTGLLHTKIQHIYEDLETITGKSGLVAYLLPNLIVAVAPWLREHIKDQRVWDRKHDLTHTGEIELPEPTAEDRAAMFDRYRQPLSPPARRHVAEISDEITQD